jgi:hypothetical protein
MTDFLSGLEVRLADRFSLSLIARDRFRGGAIFRRAAIQRGAGGGGGGWKRPGEPRGLEAAGLKVFQQRVRDWGALSAYRVGPGNYVVVDRAALPALEVIAAMQPGAIDTAPDLPLANYFLKRDIDGVRISIFFH